MTRASLGGRVVVIVTGCKQGLSGDKGIFRWEGGCHSYRM